MPTTSPAMAPVDNCSDFEAGDDVLVGRILVIVAVDWMVDVGISRLADVVVVTTTVKGSSLDD